MPDNTSTILGDGLDELRKEISIADVMRLIERTARWVDPDTFRCLPLWFPEHARGTYFYKQKWTQEQFSRSRQTGESTRTREGNIHANKALSLALGMKGRDRPNWSCCHIWGVDDAAFQVSNHVVQDRRYYSCVANMVLLPSPLKAFTDALPEVKAMLRICAKHLYGWHCDHESLAASIATVTNWSKWDDYPESWPTSSKNCRPLGVVSFNDAIKQSAKRRLKQIKSDIDSAGPHYPKKEVLAALRHWKIEF